MKRSLIWNTKEQDCLHEVRGSQLEDTKHTLASSWRRDSIRCPIPAPPVLSLVRSLVTRKIVMRTRKADYRSLPCCEDTRSCGAQVDRLSFRHLLELWMWIDERWSYGQSRYASGLASSATLWDRPRSLFKSLPHFLDCCRPPFSAFLKPEVESQSLFFFLCQLEELIPAWAVLR